MQSGRRVVVDVDLEKFFDRVNHDILIDRLQKRIEDAGVIRLIRAYLNSGIMTMAWCRSGTRARRKAGRCRRCWPTCCSTKWTRSWNGGAIASCATPTMQRVRAQPRAGERVMALLRRLYGKLRLTVNEAKSAVASVFGRKFLGYSLWVAPGGVVKRKVAAKPLATFKQRIRQLTRRSGGRSMQEVVDSLRPYLLGWKAYFRLAQTPRVWRELDEWLRHRLRAIQLKHWKRGTTMYRELLSAGRQARRCATGGGQQPSLVAQQRHAAQQRADHRYFDRLGLPRLS